MSRKEKTEDASAAIRRASQSIAKDPKRALAFLVSAGICTPTGRLTKPYRQPKA